MKVELKRVGSGLLKAKTKIANNFLSNYLQYRRARPVQ